MNGFLLFRVPVLRVLAAWLLLGTVGSARGAESDSEFGPATPGNVDVWFRAVAGGNPRERLMAMKLLKAALLSEDGNQNECVMRYPYDEIATDPVRVALTPNKEHCAVLLDAIPNLIEALRDESNREAWWILISLQPSCPPANHQVWLKWWKEKGLADFRRMAGTP